MSDGLSDGKSADKELDKESKEWAEAHFSQFKFANGKACNIQTASFTSPPKEVGTKFDLGKPPVGLIPAVAIIEEAKVYGFGREKYGEYNWAKGINYSRLLDATLRHILSFKAGEDLDPESNLSHLAHARCNLSMLLHFLNNPVEGLDDRRGI